jgi:integrase/recombinase XerD
MARSPFDLFSPAAGESPLTAVIERPGAAVADVGEQVREACQAWLVRSPSRDTRSNYAHDLRQFLAFVAIPPERPDLLVTVRPHQVAAWRDQLLDEGLTNSSVRRKMTVLRSLFSYLQTYGYVGANPAHSDFVAAPPVPRDGKTVGLSPEDCRRLLDAPGSAPSGVRDRALLAVLAYTGCRVGELARLKVGSYKQTGTHRVLEVAGKGGKERRVPLHPEAVERLEEWLDATGARDQPAGALFRPAKAARGDGRHGFAPRPMTRRAVQKLVEGYVRRLRLDPNVTVHSLRVTALTTARERGSDIIDLQSFAGYVVNHITGIMLRKAICGVARLFLTEATLIRAMLST